MFIGKYNYNKDEIIKFISETSINNDISRNRMIFYVEILVLSKIILIFTRIKN